MAEKKQNKKIASEVSGYDDSRMGVAPDQVYVPAEATTVYPSSKEPFSTNALSDLRSAVLCSTSVTDAALAFQRWRHVRLKMMFSQELKKALEAARQDEARFLSLKEELERKNHHVMHALAESSQLRNQVSTLENINKQQQGSSTMEILQEDLAKALERATSAEDEVERYNKEIRNLRERLKSAEDEAYRLGSELKATLAFNQKEKSGLLEENQVLLEQLARKDEEVVFQTQEINNLKSMLTGMRVSRSELGRIQTEQQQNSKSKTKYSKFEEKENEELQIQSKPGDLSSKVQCLPKTQPTSESPSFFPQLVDLLKKLVVCLQNNETSLDPCTKRVLPNENMVSFNSISHHNEVPCHGGGAYGNRRKLQINNHCGQFGNNNGDKNVNSFCITDAKRKAFLITCWKWRWAASACEVQALSKELDTLRSLSKEVFEKYPFMTGHMNAIHEKSEPLSRKSSENNVLLKQEPLPFEKVFSLLSSIWQTSSQSAHFENELNMKKRKLDHFLNVMIRWMQRNYKKRQLEKSISRWLLYLLKSQRDKFKLQAAIARPLPMVASATSNQGPSHLVTRSNRCSKPIKKELETPEQKAHTSEKTIHVLKDVFHHKLEAVEGVILQEANSWYQKMFKETPRYKAKSSKEYNSSLAVAAAGLVSKICNELKHCFSDTCKETMVFFDALNKDSCHSAENVEAKTRAKALPPKPMSGQVRVHTIKKTTREKM